MQRFQTFDIAFRIAAIAERLVICMLAIGSGMTMAATSQERAVFPGWSISVGGDITLVS